MGGAVSNEPEWSQLHAKRVTERVQCCFGGVVDRAEYIWDDLVIVSKIGSAKMEYLSNVLRQQIQSAQ